MRIKVWESSPNIWRADPVDLPGSPMNGEGRNLFEAIGSLIVNLERDMKHGTYRRNSTSMPIDFDYTVVDKDDNEIWDKEPQEIKTGVK